MNPSRFEKLYAALRQDPVLGLIPRALEGVVGGTEAALTLGTGALAIPANQATAGLRALAGAPAAEVIEQANGPGLTYVPQTGAGAEVLGGVGRAFESAFGPVAEQLEALQDKALEADPTGYGAPLLIAAIRAGTIDNPIGGLGRVGRAAKVGGAAGPKAWRFPGGETIPRAGTAERASYDADRMARVVERFGDDFGPVERVPLADIEGSHAITGKYPKLETYRAMARANELPPLVGFRENGRVFLLDGNGRLAAAAAEGVPDVPVLIRRDVGNAAPARGAAAEVSADPFAELLSQPGYGELPLEKPGLGKTRREKTRREKTRREKTRREVAEDRDRRWTPEERATYQARDLAIREQAVERGRGLEEQTASSPPPPRPTKRDARPWTPEERAVYQARDLAIRDAEVERAKQLTETRDLDALMAALEKKGGFTYSPAESRLLGKKDGGFVVGMYPGLSRTLAPADATPEALADFLRSNRKTLAEDPLNTVGAWRSPEGNVVLDISRTFPTREAATRAGVERGEHAIWNLKKGEPVFLDEQYLDRLTPEQAAGSAIREAKATGVRPPMTKLAGIFRALGEDELRAAAELDLHLQPARGGVGFVGAPPSIRTMEDVLARRQQLANQALLGAEKGGALWYEVEGGARKAMNPSHADLGTYTSGIHSNQASPARELTNDAEVRIARAALGPERGALTNPNFQEQAKNAIDILEGKDPAEVGGLSLKTGTYADTQRHVGRSPVNAPPTREYIDPVIDTHMGTALGYEVPAGQSTLTLGDSQHAYGKGEIMAVARAIKSDPAMLARWESFVGRGVEPTPHRVQAAIWKAEKARKVAAQKGISLEEAFRSLDAAVDSSFAKAAEAASPSERIDPSVVDWRKGGRVDPLAERLGLLQHPSANTSEVRPVWGPESMADLENSAAAAHGPFSADEQRALTRRRRQYEYDRKGEVKRDKAGKTVGRLFTREEQLAAGAVDQEQALKDLALIRMWADGRLEGGLSWRGREMPVKLPAGAAQEGTGAGARAVMEALERNPGFERLLDDGTAFHPLAEAPPSTRGDVQRGRALLLEGGLPAFRRRVQKYGYGGLLGLPLLTLGERNEQ